MWTCDHKFRGKLKGLSLVFWLRIDFKIAILDDNDQTMTQRRPIAKGITLWMILDCSLLAQKLKVEFH
jgi:hypothetical protein